jgi:hypothetical protein
MRWNDPVLRCRAAQEQAASSQNAEPCQLRVEIFALVLPRAGYAPDFTADPPANFKYCNKSALLVACL